LKMKGFPTFVTLTSDQVIPLLHTVEHHSSTYTYTPNFIEMKDTRMYLRTHIQTDGHLKPTLLG